MVGAINPMERDGCWLCDGCGEVETYRASDDTPMTVGCPVCVQNDLEWRLLNKQARHDKLRDALQEMVITFETRDWDEPEAVIAARAALKATED